MKQIGKDVKDLKFVLGISRYIYFITILINLKKNYIQEINCN